MGGGVGRGVIRKIDIDVCFTRKKRVDAGNVHIGQNLTDENRFGLSRVVPDEVVRGAEGGICIRQPIIHLSQRVRHNRKTVAFKPELAGFLVQVSDKDARRVGKIFRTDLLLLQFQLDIQRGVAVSCGEIEYKHREKTQKNRDQHPDEHACRAPAVAATTNGMAQGYDQHQGQQEYCKLTERERQRCSQSRQKCP